MTSGDVAVRYLHTEFSGASVYLLGTPSLEESMRAAGITLTEEAPDVVLVAFDKTLTYEKLEKGCTFIREGAAYLATHPDVNCPVPGGFIPDCGAICSLCEEVCEMTRRVQGQEAAPAQPKAKPGLHSDETLTLPDLAGDLSEEEDALSKLFD